MPAPESEPAAATPPEREDSVVLYRLARGGDAAARQEFFTRYTPRIHELARRSMGPRMRSMVESTDVAQEAMAEVVEGMDALEVEGRPHLQRLLARLVRHRIVAFARHFSAAKRDHLRETPLNAAGPDDSSCDGFQPVAPGRSPLELLEQREGVDLIQAALQELSADHRRAIELRMVRRLPWEDVARELGRSTPDAARMLQRRAMRELRAALRRRLDPGSA